MREDRASILRHFESCHMASKSSSFRVLLNHKMLEDPWKSIAFDRAVARRRSKTAEENAIKL